MSQVYVSLGSNIEPRHYLSLAIKALREEYGELCISPVYESAAVGFEGDNFYNLAVGFITIQDVQAVKKTLAQIETDNHRERGAEKFSARTLDIDLLLYDEVIDEVYKIPHKDILKYAFVLRPLAEIAPNVVHPLEQCTFLDLWENFDKSTLSLWQVADIY